MTAFRLVAAGSRAMVTLIEPFVKRNIFASEEEAIQELVHDYVMRQVSELQAQVVQFEQRYGLNFHQFQQYLGERSALLSQRDLSDEQRRTLSRAVMLEEDDWLDWKAAREMLESWLGLRQVSLLPVPPCSLACAAPTRRERT